MRYAVNAVGIRYVDNTLEQSIYEQMKWAIEEQGGITPACAGNTWQAVRKSKFDEDHPRMCG